MFPIKIINLYLFRVTSFVRFAIKSISIFTVHSPYLFKLTSNLQQPNVKYLSDIKKYIDFLISETKNIAYNKTNDIGATSLRIKTENQFSQRVLANGRSPLQYLLLSNIANYVKGENIIEFGTSGGIGTYALWVSNPNANIISFEGDPILHKTTSDLLNHFSGNNLKIINTDLRQNFEHHLGDFLYNLAIIDACHTYTDTLRFFNILEERMADDGIIWFDDIRWNNEMFKAWQKIVNTHNGGFSVDFGTFGLIVYRQKQPRQHFFVRLPIKYYF